MVRTNRFPLYCYNFISTDTSNSMHTSRIPVIHNFGIVSKRIAESLIEESEQKEQTYRIPSPSPVMPSSPRIQPIPTPDAILHTQRERQLDSISSKFIQEYNKSLDEIEKSPSKHKLHRKLEETLQLTDRKLNLQSKSNQSADSAQIGNLWKDTLFMYQCQGPLQIRSLTTLLNSLTSTSLLKSPHYLFTVLHMAPLELKDLMSPSETEMTSQMGSPNNYKQANTLLKAIYLGQILQTGYSRLYIHYLLGKLESYKNLSLVMKVLQSSLTSELLSWSTSSPFVWMCIKHSMLVLAYLSANIEIGSDNSIDPATNNQATLNPCLDRNTNQNCLKSSNTSVSIDLFVNISPEVFHSLEIWHETAFCHSQNIEYCILQFIKCYTSNQQKQSMIEFSLMLDILTLLSVSSSQMAETLLLLPLLNSYASHIDTTFQTTNDSTQDWKSYHEMLESVDSFYRKSIQENLTFQWENEHTSYYIHSLTKVCLQTKISYIRRLMLTGKTSCNKSTYHIKLGLIDLSGYRDDSNLDFSSKIRYLAVKGIKDVLTCYNTQVSADKQTLAPLGIREITFQTCRSCLERESYPATNFLLNHYKPCTGVLLTSSKEYLQSILKLIHCSFLKLPSNTYKSLTSSFSSISKTSSKHNEKRLLTYNSVPKPPSKSTKEKVQLEAIRGYLHSDTSSVRNELKMRNISFIMWQKRCTEDIDSSS